MTSLVQAVHRRRSHTGQGAVRSHRCYGHRCNKTAKVTWKAPSGDFSAVDNYSVTVTGAGAPQTKETGNTATELSFTFNNNDISDGTAITATVKAHNKINWSAESAASPSEKIWGDPDAPNIALSNDDTTVTAKVTLGNNRNAGCRRISLGGDVKDTIDCSDSGATFDINENDLNTREITVTATVVPQRDASSGTGKSSFVPQYKSSRPLTSTPPDPAVHAPCIGPSRDMRSPTA